jgi:integrase
MLIFYWLGNHGWKVAVYQLWHTVRASVKESTWTAYDRRGAAYVKWCNARGRKNRWHSAETLAAYIADLGVSRKWGGVWSEIGSLGKWFEVWGVPFPGKDVLVKRALTGLKKLQKSRVTKKKPIKIFHLLEWAKKTRVSGYKKILVRNMVLFLLGFFVGLRVAELVKLRWKDVSITGEVVVVKVRRVKGAQQRERWSVMPGKNRVLRVDIWLRRWRKLISHKGQDFVFPGRSSHLGPAQVRKVVKDLVLVSGEKSVNYSSHSLRRGGAQFLERSGGDLQDLRAFGGWRGKYSPFEYLGSRLGAKIRAARKIAQAL